MSETVYLNGFFVPREEAKISITDYGFLFGFAVFETMRVYNGKLFRLESHLARLENSVRKLGFSADLKVLKNAVLDTILANGLRQARVRLTVSAGVGAPVPDPATCVGPTILVLAVPYIPPSSQSYQRGESVIISSIRRNSQSPLPGMKTANFLESILARQESRAAQVDDAVLLNEEGVLAEASSSNIFVVKGKTLKTPSKGNGILPGITREVVLELATLAGIPTHEGAISTGELLSADEAFLTNSMLEIMPVSQVNGKTIGSGEPGPTTSRLMAAYKEEVAQETA
jgi:branched-chain amino acid aminotransferase group I